MIRQSIALLGAALLGVVSAQTPSPTPSPTPAASPVEAASTPAPSPSPAASPAASPAVSPAATPAAGEAEATQEAATPNVNAVPVPTPIDVLKLADTPVSGLGEGEGTDPLDGANPATYLRDLPADFSDPGLASAPYVKPDIKDLSPSTATIEKMNREAAETIAAYAQSIRNPNVPDMDITAAVNTALRQNPDILNAIETIRITRGQLIEVRSQLLPQVSATAGYQNVQESLADPKVPQTTASEPIVIPGANGGEDIVLDFSNGGRGAYTNPQSWVIGFQASQLLFDGGGAIAGVRAASAFEDSAYFQLRQTINAVIADVKTQFYQVILNRALIVAQQQSVELLTQQLRDQVNRFEAGTVPRFNVLQAEVALANAQPPLIQALNALRISQYELVRLLGIDYSPAKPSEVPFNVIGNLNYKQRAINADESIRTAIERNPALKAQRQNLLAQAQNVNVAFAGYLPSVSALADYTWQSNQAFEDLGEVTQGWTFGFQGSWAIFDGLATTGRVDQARAQLSQAVINYNNTVRTVILDVQEAISNLQTALETVLSQEASVVQAAEAFRLSQERLDAGAGTQLDVLNAQTSLLQAQTNVLTARYDYINAMAQYDLALSLDAQYEEVFDDPLSPGERKKFDIVTDPTAPQPPLPRRLRDQDPIVGFAENAPRQDEAPANPPGVATPTPTPDQASSPRRPPRPPGR